jgi:hypothetical protein
VESESHKARLTHRAEQAERKESETR